MSTIITRAGKGEALTHAEMDANLNNLNTDKVEASIVLLKADNLSTVSSVATARTNLGVTATGADTTYSFRANNLSDLANAATARTNLGVTATNIPFTPAGTISSSNVQAALEELATENLVLGTSTSASGTSVDFVSIPSGTKRITVTLSGVSVSGTSFLMIQIGDSGGVETSGYTGCTQRGTSFTAYSTGWSIDNSAGSANAVQGSMVITLMDSSTNTWTISGVVGLTGSTYTANGGGSKSLSGTLDRVRITTVNGTDTFDAGTINILYE